MKRELQTIAVLGCCILLIGFCLLGFAGGWFAAGLWLPQAGLIWGFVCHYTRRRLDLNRAGADAPLYGGLGWGNRLTLLRGGLIALAGGFLLRGPDPAFNPWLASIPYTMAAMLDRLDGYVARRGGQVSLLGNELDIAFDALGLVVAPLLAIGLGKIHWSYLLLSMAYYLFQYGLRLRRGRGLPVHALPANPLRRSLAGFQMGFVAVALWPLLNPSLTEIAGAAFMLPVLFGFAVDWWLISGRLQPRAINTLGDFSHKFFQPGLRVLLVAELLLMATATGLDSLPGLGAGRTGYVPALVLLFGAGLIALGIAGRLGALLLIALLAWRYPGGGIDSLGFALIFTCSWILLLGTGRFSLWQWDDEWVTRYDGG